MTAPDYVEAGLVPYVAAGTVGAVVQVTAVPGSFDIDPADAGHRMFLVALVVLDLV
jgi:hypothetical protein